MKPAPRDLSQDTLFALLHSLIQLLESKGVLSTQELAAFVTAESNQTDMQRSYAPSTLSELSRVLAWMINRTSQ